MRTTVEELFALGEEVDELRTQAEEHTAKLAVSEGALRAMLAGTTSTTMTVEDDHSLRYAALFAPHFFWTLHERALFEAHLDLKLADGSTGLNLEFAALWFTVNDSLTIGAGKLLTPFGFYNEQLHTTWINRLPDEPLVVADHVGVSPTHLVGVSARGAWRGGTQRAVWAVFFGSAPHALLPSPSNTHSHSEPMPVVMGPATGALDYDRYHRWATGGRAGYLPIPSLELGYSLHVARVDPRGSPLARILMFTQAIDVNYNDVVPALRGTLDAHLEAVLGSAQPQEHDDWPADRSRAGLYAQLAYRPSEVDAQHLARLEVVTRYDRLDGIKGNQPTERATLGLNYWIQPSLVIKAAAQVVDPPTGDNTLRGLFQLAGGF